MRTLRTADTQILNELRGLTRSWTGERRPEGMCDVLFDRLLDVRPDLCWNPAGCNQHDPKELRWSTPVSD